MPGDGRLFYVRQSRLLLAALMMAAILCLAPSALGEPARVVTRGGVLNLRKTPEESTALVDQIPNQSMVDVEEVLDDTWAKVTYKKKTGYVKAAYLKLPSQMIGQRVYGDHGALMMRAAPDAESALVYPVSAAAAVKVLAVEGDWALAECHGKTGYVPLDQLTYQYAEPQETAGWIDEKGTAALDCPVTAEANDKSPVIAALTAGAEVTVTQISKGFCLVVTDDFCGWAPTDAIVLSGVEATDARAGSLYPVEAVNLAGTALDKAFKAYAKERLYSLTAVYDDGADSPDGPMYLCGFYNDQDQYRYAALVHAETGKVTFTAQYEGFRALEKTVDLLPEGEMEVTFSADSLAVGDVLDVTVKAWTLHQCQYILTLNGDPVAATEAGAHFAASFRPRAAGEYLLAVTVTDETGASRTEECGFSVSENPDAAGPSAVYSQKDGWWKDKIYRHSNLDKSGCAIFALAHALERLGFQGEDTWPENLAVQYAVCLIKGEGTSNELLIKKAAKDFGFKTQTALITDEKKIVSLLRTGAVFSFSVAKGHIAMVSGVSEDGTMARIVDSAPGATYERMVNVSMYYQMRGGAYRAALTLDELPGARWYLDTGEYGGLEYWMPVSYLVKRGVRMIQPITE